MNIGLIGYGRMGKEVEAICLERGHKIALIVDPSKPDSANRELTLEDTKKLDGLIEFALPDHFAQNAEIYTSCGLPTVIGTTGWLDYLPSLEKLVKDRNASVLYGSNYSIGAHILLNLTEKAAAMINKHPQYDIMIHEYHHKMKVDSPSGTALSLAKRILNVLPRKKKIQTQSLNRAIFDDELHVSSTRGGRFFGVHTVSLDSEVDTLELSHTAHSRRGLALGAVLALEWLEGKKGLYTVEEFMKSSLDSNQ